MVYSLLKTSLWGQERYPLVAGENTDWNAVYQELCDHAVDALAVDTLSQVSDLDPQLRRAWMHKAMKRVAKWNRIMKQQDGLYSLLREANLPFVVVKGAAAAMYYSKPEYRTMGDIDLLVPAGDFARAHQIFLDDGYELVHEDDGRHIELKKNGIVVELHHHYASMSDPEIAAALDRQIFDKLSSGETGVLEQYHFSMLPRLENGLSLLAHIDHHMESGLGLRQIIDWMLFVDRELDDSWWNQEFGPWTKRLGMDTLAVTVTRMCQLYLGLREDGISWCAGAEEDLCRDLMTLTMERGNFGKKTGNSAMTIPVVTAMLKLTRIPVMLQTRGCNNWTALKKYPFLKPFAWLYQLCRYIRIGFSRKNPIKSLISDIRSSRRQDDIMDRLHVGKRQKRDVDLIMDSGEQP